MADRTSKITILVTGVFAIPLLVAAVYLALQWRDDAMRPELSPVKSTLLCVSGNIAKSPELTQQSAAGPQPERRAMLGHVCGVGDTVYTDPKRTTSLVLRDLDYPDWYLYSVATFDTYSFIPDTSIWPFTDPDRIEYFREQDGVLVHSSTMPGNLRDSNPAMYRAIADVQRTLNERILLLAGGVIILIAFVATATRLVSRRAFRPVAVTAPPLGMGSIVSRLSEVSSDLVLLVRLDAQAQRGTGSPAGFDLAALAHRESADRYPPNLAYVVDLGDDPVPVQGDPELINLLLIDLLDNAERQATSSVTLRLRTTPQFAVLEAIVDDSASSSHYSTQVLPLR